MKFSFRHIFLSAILCVSSFSLFSCGDAKFSELSEERQREYAEEYMRNTYNEEWSASGVIGRTDMFADKFPSGMFISTLENHDTGDVINMWITPDGEIFENRFMLRMREPAKQYIVDLVENAVPYCKAYSFIIIDVPELIGDYRKDGNIEPLLTEQNLNIEIEIYCSSSEPFKSDDIQKLMQELKDVQFDHLDIWNTSHDIHEFEVENTVLKEGAQHVWKIEKYTNGKYSCVHPEK